VSLLKNTNGKQTEASGLILSEKKARKHIDLSALMQFPQAEKEQQKISEEGQGGELAKVRAFSFNHFLST